MWLDECSQLSTLLAWGGYNENYLQSMCYPAGIFIQAGEVSTDFVDKGKSNYIFASNATSISIWHGHRLSLQTVWEGSLVSRPSGHLQRRLLWMRDTSWIARNKIRVCPASGLNIISRIASLNWRINPKFPSLRLDKVNNPDCLKGHIWFVPVLLTIFCKTLGENSPFWPVLVFAEIPVLQFVWMDPRVWAPPCFGSKMETSSACIANLFKTRGLVARLLEEPKWINGPIYWSAVHPAAPPKSEISALWKNQATYTPIYGVKSLILDPPTHSFCKGDVGAKSSSEHCYCLHHEVCIAGPGIFKPHQAKPPCRNTDFAQFNCIFNPIIVIILKWLISARGHWSRISFIHKSRELCTSGSLTPGTWSLSLHLQKRKDPIRLGLGFFFPQRLHTLWMLAYNIPAQLLPHNFFALNTSPYSTQ